VEVVEVVVEAAAVVVAGARMEHIRLAYETAGYVLQAATCSTVQMAKVYRQWLAVRQGEVGTRCMAQQSQLLAWYM
jgi:hypothetical protein